MVVLGMIRKERRRDFLLKIRPLRELLFFPAVLEQ